VEEAFWNSFKASKGAAKLELSYVMYRKAMSANAEVAKSALLSLLNCEQ
jgi:hypothetical protein